MQSTASSTIFIDRIWQAEGNMRIVRNITLVLLGTLILYISAKVNVAIVPVPVTMQTAVVMIIGAAFGWKLGGATLLTYMAQGAAGLPVFATTPEKGIGLAYMMGPTGGYLVGFVLAAVAVGHVAQKFGTNRFFITLASCLYGAALILGLGFAYLSTLIGAEKAWEFGVLPFIYIEVAKAGFAAAVIALSGWAAFRR